MTLVLLVWLAACGGGGSSPSSPSTPPPAASEIAITVDASRTRQALEDPGGGNFIHTFSQVTAGLDPIGRFNFEGIGPRHVRLRMALEDWEPQNDDGDPGRASAGGFRDDRYNHGAFLLAQEAAARGVGITASIWDVPGWMVSNPGSERNRKIPPSMYPELAESMGEWLRTARSYGAEVSYVSFNEADIGVNVSLLPAEHAALVAEVGSRLWARGHRVKWLLGDCSNMASCAAYARPIWEDAAVRPYLGLFAFHTWDGTSASDGALGGLYDFGRTTGLPMRATEGGWDAALWQRPDQFPTWNHALQLARVYVRVLRLTGASGVQYWQMLGRDYPINDGTAGYPAFQVIRQMQRQLTPGAQVVETAGDRGLVCSLGARDGGELVLYLVNAGTQDQPVAVSGLPGGSYRQVRSSAAGSDQEQASVAGGGTVSLTLPKESVTLLTTRR